MDHISFVILHYISYSYTQNCITSIIDNITYPNYSIIVVDNNSSNNSAKLLQEDYKDNPKVVILLSKSNSGFAKGNNIGYSYAKDTLHSSYIIATNNDTLFTQCDFLEEIISLFKKHNYYILGPDIVTLDNRHQNPYRANIIGYKSATKWLRNRRLWTLYLRLDKRFKLSTRFSFAQQFYKKREKKNNSVLDSTLLQSDVVLQGACIIFSPLYISQMDYAFYPDTYMYCEEDILAYQCKAKGWKILYSPSIRVCHAECGSTKELHSNTIDKELFQSTNIVKSLKILIKIMKE
jgi:GT2 family glycosyltransferase